MNFKGTKGEWEVKPSESKTAFNVIGTVLGGNYKIARCPYLIIGHEKIDKMNKDEAEANAKLIASAPDLLKSCIEIIKGFDNAPNSWLMTTEVSMAAANIKHAIKKALE